MDPTSRFPFRPRSTRPTTANVSSSRIPAPSDAFVRRARTLCGSPPGAKCLGLLTVEPTENRESTNRSVVERVRHISPRRRLAISTSLLSTSRSSSYCC
jgi:hypothetical protein